MFGLDASLDGITRKAIISLAEELGMKGNVKALSESDIIFSNYREVSSNGRYY